MSVSWASLHGAGRASEMAESRSADVYTISHGVAKAKRYVEIIREEIENCWQG
ncbi:MAG: hypothetical protein ACLTQL_05275 [Eisenbergiella sp.]